MNDKLINDIIKKFKIDKDLAKKNYKLYFKLFKKGI